ncbi:MAG: hypothetical protein ACM3ZA_01020 [Bacillota bacterium]
MAGEELGYGTKLQAGDGAQPEVFTDVALLTSIGGISLEADDVEITTYASPDGFKEFMRGLVDAGEVEFEGIFTNDASQTALFTDLASGAGPDKTKNWKIVLPGTPALATWSFAGYLKSFAVDPSSINDKIAFSGTIKVTGKPVLA